MSYWILGIAIASVLAISYATYRFINLHSAVIVFIPLFTTVIMLWNLHSNSFQDNDTNQCPETNEDEDKVPNVKSATWFTKQRRMYATYLGLTGLLIGSLWYVFSSYGITDWKTWSMAIGLVVVFGISCYYTYYWFYPTYFWRRGVLQDKHWNSAVDCRESTEYEKGHLEKAIHWPLDTLTHSNVVNRIMELKSPVLVYDNTGKLAKQWKDKFDLIASELQLEGYIIAYTDAHQTQIPKKIRSNSTCLNA